MKDDEHFTGIYHITERKVHSMDDLFEMGTMREKFRTITTNQRKMIM